jgi:hypothetical protein
MERDPTGHDFALHYAKARRMSWDLLIFNTQGRKPPPLEELQESDTEPFGPAVDLRRRLSERLPAIDWSDQAWGIYQGDGFFIEFALGDDDPVIGITLLVRGGGDPVSTIVQLAQAMRWSVLDIATGQFLDLENPADSAWREFQAYRDRIMEPYRDNDVGKQQRDE